MKLKKSLASFRLPDWLRVFLLTILLFVFFIFYNNSNFVINGEEKVLTKIDVLHEMILPGKFKPPYNFIFINATATARYVDRRH